ncbi:hypothetical protein P797_27015 [Pseudomonas aeruginosa VRFPA04]|nr:hypothetical protein P797_27015 [Pseudomonas aeruginosa VRFPA04]
MLRSLTVLLLAFALLLGSAVARAAPRELTWSQLIPAGARPPRRRCRSTSPTPSAKPARYVQANYGIYLPLAWPSDYEWSLLGAILAAAVLIGCVPAWRAYRQSLADGLSIRL